MVITELKRKLRQLKKLEGIIRFANTKLSGHEQYVWNEYFSLKDEKNAPVKYNLYCLLNMDHPELRAVFDEYFYEIYFWFYKENGIAFNGIYDTKLLSRLGLPPASSTVDIKHRFRELAKKYHPDLGGESGKFIELMDTYRKLMDDE